MKTCICFDYRNDFIHIFVSKSSAWVVRTERRAKHKNLIKYQFQYGKLIGTTRTRPIFVRFHYILLFRHWAARYDINYCTCDKATKKTSWNALTPNSVVCFDGYTVSLRMYLFCFPFNPLPCSVIGFLIILACLATAGSIAPSVRQKIDFRFPQRMYFRRVFILQ